MKSAYELAMERLGESDSRPSLTEEQKSTLAAIDEKYRARIAEREIFLSGLIEKARSEGNFAELTELETQRAREISRLESDREQEKEKVRQS